MQEFFGLVQAAAACFVAWVAFQALGTWKDQHKAKIHSDFLDQLSDALNRYTVSMLELVTWLQFLKIALDAHAGLSGEGDKPAFVVLAQRRGSEYGEQIKEPLRETREAYAKLRALVVKGQVLGFDDYSDCLAASDQLEKPLLRLENVRTFLVWEHPNWQNPEVLRVGEKAFKADSDELRVDIGVQDTLMLDFIRKCYAKQLSR